MANPRTQNVLIVDDQAASLKMAAYLVERPGVDVYVAADGEEALRLSAQRPYDLFLLDIMMPGMSGFELCARLKAAPATAETPVIFLTALQDEADIVKGFELGAADYVSKPFKPQELNARVDTQLKLSQQRAELRQKIVDLEALNAQLDSFSHMVSHDLKSPLYSLTTYASALRDREGDKLDADGRFMLERMLATGARMRRLIDGLLAFSRSAGEPHLEKVDLSTLAVEIAQELMADDGGRSVVFDIQKGLAARCDAALIQTALANLIGNAWKFSAGAPEARIVVARATPADEERACGPGEALFRVADNGAGFDPARAGELFQPFKRLHSPREFEGHGIGLATVKRIIERHGGRIWAESAPRAGATFWFTLPL